MKTILIVDDEYDIVTSLEIVLAMEGYSVRTAFHGKEALDFLNKGARPDLILSDLMMPVLDGYALVRALRNHDEYAGIPVILTSAAQLDPSRVDKEHFELFIRKPFDLERLINAIKTVLEERTGGQR